MKDKILEWLIALVLADVALILLYFLLKAFVNGFPR
jgi:hypothetical protein